MLLFSHETHATVRLPHTRPPLSLGAAAALPLDKMIKMFVLIVSRSSDCNAVYQLQVKSPKH